MPDSTANYVKRSVDILGSFSQMTERDIELKIIQPLLELLGWDRYEDVKTQYDLVAGTTTIKPDYALFLNGSPEVVVEVKSTENLRDQDISQLESYMRQAETKWGLLTNGMKFQVLNEDLNSINILFEIEIDSLDEEWEKIEILSKDKIRSGESETLKERLDTKKQGIEKLKNSREDVKKKLIDQLVAETNESLLPEIEQEVNGFVEDLIENIDSSPAEDNIPREPEEVIEMLGTGLPATSEEERYRRAKHLLSAYEYLQNQKVVTSNEIKECLAREYSESLSKEEVDRRWTNYIRDGLSKFPQVERPARGSSQIWRYISTELDQRIRISEIDDWILNLENIPVGYGDAVSRQQAMIQRAYNILKEDGSITKEELSSRLPDYTAHYQDFDGFWSYCIQEALKQCDDVEAPVAGHQGWRYIGDEELPPELELDIEEWIKDLDVSGQKMTRREREALLQYSYNFLQEVGEAQRGDFEEHIMKNIPSKTGRYNRFQGLWTYLLKDGLETAPDVRTYSSGKVNPTTYVYSG